MAEDREELGTGPATGTGSRTEKPTSQEIEVKFRADGRALEAVLASGLLKSVSVSPARELVSTYFDTEGHELKRAGMTLRVRRKSRSIPLMGVKWLGGDDAVFARGEIEVRCPDGIPNVELFEPVMRERLKAATAGRPLAAVFETRFKRRAAVLRHGHSEIELALDEGAVTAGTASLPLAEVELELKSGNVPDLLGLAAALARDCGLSLEFEPKAGRGYRLAAAEPPRPQKATPLGISAGASFDDLVTAVVANALSHFAANWAALRGSDAPESVHQLRVALRRLRSALGVFRKTLQLPELEDVRSEARRIASALGPARESDAFRANALAGPLKDGTGEVRGAGALLDAVEARRCDSYVTARRLIEDPRTTLFVIDVQNFLARRAWRAALSREALGLLTSDAKTYAAGVLDGLRRRALKRGKHLPDMPDVERHELRIALKNLRYAVEFFGSLFGKPKDVRSYLRCVASLQEDLGTHNDAVTAKAFIDSLGLPPDADVHFASGYLLGWYRHATLAADIHLAKKWKDFKRQDVFWP